MKFCITIQKEIDIPSLTISNIRNFSDISMSHMLHEIKQQIQKEIPSEIKVRDRYTQMAACQCSFCNKSFATHRARTMHLNNSHCSEIREKGQFFLACHRTKIKSNSYLYILLENYSLDGEYLSSHKLVGFKFNIMGDFVGLT